MSIIFMLHFFSIFAGFWEVYTNLQNAFSYEDSDIKKPPPAESYSSGRQSSVTLFFFIIRSYLRFLGTE